MTRPKPELLCRYHYDPIDRLVGCSPLGQQDTHGFYRLNRLSTEIQGAVQTSWLQTPDLLLAQRRLASGQGEGMLLATDAPGSVIHALSAGQPQGFAYLPYGLRHPLHASLPLPGFNGERLDPVTGHYLLGNGYRAFNPVLMRFNSPDSLSPFWEGGLNAYGYCMGDPTNYFDPTGHIPLMARLWRSFRARLNIRSRLQQNTQQLSTRAPAVNDMNGNIVKIGNRTTLVDTSPMSTLPPKQGPLTPQQVNTVEMAADYLKINAPKSLAEMAASALPTARHWPKLPDNHPLFTDKKLSALVRNPKTTLSRRFFRARSEHEKLIVITQTLRQYPNGFSS
ncbi:RHS repeat-associated core domain-containing protein [Pseudomonas ovata]|uniref:RHS repeat-associated core domain-containing protein n=1 Tax=Pseudomonas ovata TaxID=1839709 RepID=UPI000D69DDA7|nr:RHS repeat-associated core domain-containing protein [Pseudomonas ovata]